MVLRTGQALTRWACLLFCLAWIADCRSDSGKETPNLRAKFAYSVQIGERYEIWEFDLADEKTRPLFQSTHADLFDPRWDAEVGRWIFTAQTESGRRFMAGSPEGGSIVQLQLGHPPLWASAADPNPTGPSLICEAPSGDASTVWEYDGTEWNPLAGLKSAAQPRWVDGNRFVFLEQTGWEAQPRLMGSDGVENIFYIKGGVIGPYAIGGEKDLWLADGEGRLARFAIDPPSSSEAYSFSIRVYGVAVGPRGKTILLEAAPNESIGSEGHGPGLYLWIAGEATSPRRLEIPGASAGQAAFRP